MVTTTMTPPSCQCWWSSRTLRWWCLTTTAGSNAQQVGVYCVCMCFECAGVCVREVDYVQGGTKPIIGMVFVCASLQSPAGCTHQGAAAGPASLHQVGCLPVLQHSITRPGTTSSMRWWWWWVGEKHKCQRSCLSLFSIRNVQQLLCDPLVCVHMCVCLHAATPCERFAAAPGYPPCKTNELTWCQTDLAANVYSWPRFIADDMRFGVLDSGQGASHDGFMADVVRTQGWKVGVCVRSVCACMLTRARPVMWVRR